MKYTQKSFSSGPASKEYRDNYEKTFGKKPDTGATEAPAVLCQMIAPGNKLCVRPYGHKGECDATPAHR